MTALRFCCLALVAIFIEVSNAQCIGLRTVVPVSLVETAPASNSKTSSTFEDLSALLLLAKALDNNEKTPQAPVNSALNVDEIIAKLINALVYTTTQNSGGCNCGNGAAVGYNPDGSNAGLSGGYNTGAGSYIYNGASKSSYNNGYNSNNGGSLVDLSLINGASKDNVLEVDLGGQKLLGVGLGGQNQPTTTTTMTSSQTATSATSGGSGNVGAVTGIVQGIL